MKNGYVYKNELNVNSEIVTHAIYCNEKEADPFIASITDSSGNETVKSFEFQEDARDWLVSTTM